MVALVIELKEALLVLLHGDGGGRRVKDGKTAQPGGAHSQTYDQAQRDDPCPFDQRMPGPAEVGGIVAQIMLGLGGAHPGPVWR